MSNDTTHATVSDHDALDKLHELIKDIRIAMLTTQGR